MTCHQHEVLLFTNLTVNSFVLCLSKNLCMCFREAQMWIQQIWGGVLPWPSRGPSLFYERLCLCMNRCKLPLCVKLENPELSREECDHSLYCSLLHSGKCVYMCVWEKDGIRGTEVNVWRKRVWEPKRGKWVCMMLTHFRVLMWTIAGCASSQGSEGVFAVIPPWVMWLE